MTATKTASVAPAGRPRRNRETDRMKAIKEYADSVGLRLLRFNPTAPPIIRDGKRIMRRGSFNAPGVADFVGFCPGGRFIAIEVKEIDGDVSDEQALFLDGVTAAGGIALIAYTPVDVARLANEARASGSWYGVRSPYSLPHDYRLKLVLKLDAKRAKQARRK